MITHFLRVISHDDPLLRLYVVISNFVGLYMMISCFLEENYCYQPFLMVICGDQPLLHGKCID